MGAMLINYICHEIMYDERLEMGQTAGGTEHSCTGAAHYGYGLMGSRHCRRPPNNVAHRWVELTC